MGKMQIKLDKISIKWRIFLYLIGFCLLLLVLLWLLQTVFLDSFYKQVKLSQIKSEAKAMSAVIAQDNREQLATIVEQREDMYVEVWLPHRGTLLVAGNWPDFIHSKMTTADKSLLFTQALENGGNFTQHYYTTDLLNGNRVREDIRYALILESKEGNPQLLIVSSNISPVSATISTLRVQLAYLSVIMLLLAVGIALLISKRVSGPIEQLNHSAAELGRGNYDVRFLGQGYREIAELSDTLDRAAHELSKTDALRRELIANVSHDLRTPLTLIAGYGEMIRDLPGEYTPENAQVIIDEANRLTSLVNNLLDLSKLQTGTKEPRITRFSLTQSIEEIISRFTQLALQSGCLIRFERGEDACVRADEEQFAQVLYNFLSNALTYSGTNKVVTVRQIMRAEQVVVEVEDMGEGILPEELPYIWDRYYRAGHRRAVEGTGLGLSIVKAILEQHPGIAYGARSQPGAGSVFWFSIPRA